MAAAVHTKEPTTKERIHGSVPEIESGSRRLSATRLVSEMSMDTMPSAAASTGTRTRAAQRVRGGGGFQDHSASPCEERAHWGCRDEWQRAVTSGPCPVVCAVLVRIPRAGIASALTKKPRHAIVTDITEGKK